jgi:Phosphodiester glycosidase
MRTPRRFAVPLVLVAATLLLSPAEGVGAATLTVNHQLIAPGTYFSWGTDVSGGNPRQVAILEVHPGGTDATIDTAMPKASMPGSDFISRMVPKEANAIAGVNGDFGSVRPDHAFLMDGDLWQSGLESGVNFGVRRDETGASIGKPHVNVSVTTPTSTVSVDRVNSSEGVTAAQAKTEVAMFSPRGGTSEKPAVKVCSVRLKSPTPLAWTAHKKGVQRKYTVDKQKCAKKSATTTPLGVQANTLVLTSAKGPGTRQAQIKAFKSLIGHQVTVKWSMGGFSDVLDAIGGDPQLLVNGVINTSVLNKAKCKKGSTVGCNNPRTAIGINQACVDGSGDCTIWIVVVDGRQGTWSKGMCLTDNKTLPSGNTACIGAVGLAHFMQNLGAVDAINLDGGGSTGMWIRTDLLSQAAKNVVQPTCQSVQGAANPTKGCFVNRPTTDGTTIKERSAQSAVMVLNGPDTNEPL